MGGGAYMQQPARMWLILNMYCDLEAQTLMRCERMDGNQFARHIDTDLDILDMFGHGEAKS